MIESPPAEISIDAVKSAVIKTLMYFDVFNYPLTMSEIARYCQQEKADYETIRLSVNQLMSEEVLFKLDHFYSLQNNHGLATRRKTGNTEAKKLLRIAKKFSKLISWFPFVRGIYLSGSLSKGYADRNADIDYFVITKPNRLWLCRTLLMLFKKIFLLNSKKYFCINYFIDTDHLEVPDKNIFTATEIVTIIPTYNANLYSDFMEANRWKAFFYPNFKPVHSLEEKKIEPPFPKKIAEKLLNGFLGDRLEQFCFDMTLNKWNHKFKDMNEAEFENNMRSRPYVSKHHPSGMQFRVLDRLEEKLNNFERRHHLKLC